MKFTFGDSKKFANVHIFEAITKEPDARVVEISGTVSWEKPSLFKGQSRFLLYGRLRFCVPFLYQPALRSQTLNSS